jgi:hypothetical protein
MPTPLDTRSASAPGKAVPAESEIPFMLFEDPGAGRRVLVIPIGWVDVLGVIGTGVVRRRSHAASGPLPTADVGSFVENRRRLGRGAALTGVVAPAVSY